MEDIGRIIGLGPPQPVDHDGRDIQIEGGPTKEGGPWSGGQWDSHPWHKPVRCLACERSGARCQPIGQTNSMPPQPIYPPGCMMGSATGGGYQAPQVPPTSTEQPVPPEVSSAPDIGSLLSGEIMGIPSWLVIGGLAWFFLFRKGR